MIPLPDDEPGERALAVFLEKHIRGEAPHLETLAAEHPEVASRAESHIAVLDVLKEFVDPSTKQTPWPAEVGPYKLLQRIGQGGMGTVFLAESLRDQRLVALKLLNTTTSSPASSKRFAREASIAQRLRHPNLVTVYEHGVDQHYAYYVMEFVPGASLATILARVRALREEGEVVDLRRLVEEEVAVVAQCSGVELEDLEPPAEDRTETYIACVARIVAEVADGLAYLHGMQMLHRDVKPSNILIGRSMTPRLADFGLARDMAQSREQASLTTGMLGTLDYMSPEMVQQGASGVDHRSDVYSLGITLYHLLTLRTPQTRDGTLKSLVAMTRDDPPSPRHLAPEVPRDLETIVLKAIEKNPKHRYASASEFAEDLRRLLRYERIRARPASVLRRLGRSLWRHRLVFSGLLLTVLAIVIIGLVERAARKGEHHKLVSRATALLEEDNFAEAHALVIGANALRETPELAELRRMAEGILPVAFRVSPSGAVLEVTSLDHSRQTNTLRFGPTTDEGQRAFEAWLRVGSYRVVLEKPGFGYAEHLLEVPWKRRQPGLTVQLRRTEDVIRDMVLIPAARYGLGFTPTGGGRTPLDLEERVVGIEAFYIDRQEVSNADYDAFVQATGARPPWPDGLLPPDEAKLPVLGVTWVEAMAYAEWVGKRLPTQDEWEAAARGDKSLVYPWGNAFSHDYAHVAAPLDPDDPIAQPIFPRFLPVDAATKDVSPFGVMHMTGNAREWVFDVWVPRMDTLPEETWQMPNGYRVVKGSSALERATPNSCRASTRVYLAPDRPLTSQRREVGFRCAKSKRP